MRHRTRQNASREWPDRFACPPSPGLCLRTLAMLDPPRRPLAHLTAAKALLGLGALALSLSLLPGEATADIYTYTDSQGVVHVTSKPTGAGRGSQVIKSPDRKKPGVATVRFGDSDARETKSERFNRYNEWIRQASV